ncbi:hypothetical protein BDV12DRAFT_50156 [Aspergillus spectabilis]
MSSEQSRQQTQSCLILIAGRLKHWSRHFTLASCWFLTQSVSLLLPLHESPPSVPQLPKPRYEHSPAFIPLLRSIASSSSLNWVANSIWPSLLLLFLGSPPSAVRTESPNIKLILPVSSTVVDLSCS